MRRTKIISIFYPNSWFRTQYNRGGVKLNKRKIHEIAAIIFEYKYNLTEVVLKRIYQNNFNKTIKVI